jgi:hypothetical protein
MKKFIKLFLEEGLGIDIGFKKATCIKVIESCQNKNIKLFYKNEKVKYKYVSGYSVFVASLKHDARYITLSRGEFESHFKIGRLRAIIGKFVDEKDNNMRHFEGEMYVRRIKMSDHFLDFDPFDNPYGRSQMFYPKITLKILNKYRYGIYYRFDDHKNTCYSFGNSKHELQKFCDERNALRLKELQARQKGTP